MANQALARPRGARWPAEVGGRQGLRRCRAGRRGRWGRTSAGRSLQPGEWP